MNPFAERIRSQGRDCGNAFARLCSRGQAAALAAIGETFESWEPTVIGEPTAVEIQTMAIASELRDGYDEKTRQKVTNVLKALLAELL